MGEFDSGILAAILLFCLQYLALSAVPNVKIICYLCDAEQSADILDESVFALILSRKCGSFKTEG